MDVRDQCIRPFADFERATSEGVREGRERRTFERHGRELVPTSNAKMYNPEDTPRKVVWVEVGSRDISDSSMVV